MTNLATHLLETAARLPDARALTLDEHTVTYAEFAQRARAVADDLIAKGLTPGDRVGLILPNVPAYGIYFYGIQLAGLVAVPMNPLLKAREIHYHLENSGSRAVFTLGATADEVRSGAGEAEVIEVDPLGASLASREPALADAVERADDDDCVILYTSGTTGRPKGARLTHWNMRSNALVGQKDLLLITEKDVVMGCLPLFHVFGLTCGLNACILGGAELTLLPRFDSAKALEMLERDKVTLFEGVPTMYQGLLAAAAAARSGSGMPDVSSLRAAISGGSAMPLEVMRHFEEAFDCLILEGYGLSETAPIATFNLMTGERRPGTVGAAVPGVEVRILDDMGGELPRGESGEVAVRGDNVMKGYWENPEATAAAIPDGWFRTGDIGTMDEDGFVTIVDRKKDMILHGGYNVYPREVEEVLYEHPAIAEAAVVGIPDETYGENVAAAVSLTPGSTVTPEEIRAFVAERLAAYKKPAVVWILDGLPKGPTGKILRREIRASHS
ncbi:long-chain fatty acid--CoA ligase [Falsarthrobacter nasiphocae]|uniref:Long-chain acyl-CoA synthetase n=1 Tax=Falsarthrobacter nasiphocae TaxID=189863 RepID=A0AAE4C879_9MICC|nr:long-chain fatty acid--CoA ligase [Falsarthrobacter nasiphocae]MDR6892135.1 long-chain acyl-CoA synthetase [Falsarthrobacter nasiphocae]